jgi:hypothetical protein
MRLAVNGPETSARVFGPTTASFDAVVDHVGSMLDAIAAVLRRHVDTQAIASAMMPMAKELFFLAAVFIAAIVPRSG